MFHSHAAYTRFDVFCKEKGALCFALWLATTLLGPSTLFHQILVAQTSRRPPGMQLITFACVDRVTYSPIFCRAAATPSTTAGLAHIEIKYRRKSTWTFMNPLLYPTTSVALFCVPPQTSPNQHFGQWMDVSFAPLSWNQTYAEIRAPDLFS